MHKIYKNADIEQIVQNSMLVSSRCLQYQIFNGVSPDEIKLQTTIVNIKTREVMSSVSLDEEVTINLDDWDE